MITTPILTVNPNKDSDYAAEFKLYTEKWDFKANIGHSNDAMYNNTHGLFILFADRGRSHSL